jgi:hypothetical protein
MPDEEAFSSRISDDEDIRSVENLADTEVHLLCLVRFFHALCMFFLTSRGHMSAGVCSRRSWQNTAVLLSRICVCPWSRVALFKRSRLAVNPMVLVSEAL